VGRYVTVLVVLAPGATAKLAVWTSKHLLLDTMLSTDISELPTFEICRNLVRDCPTVTLPKSSKSGVRAIDGEIPVPETVMDGMEFSALWIIASVPFCAPNVTGENETLIVTESPAPRFSDVGPAENLGFELVILAIARTPLLVFLSLKFRVEDEPAATFPKFKEA
jgi:hypothetical protein